MLQRFVKSLETPELPHQQLPRYEGNSDVYGSESDDGGALQNFLPPARSHCLSQYASQYAEHDSILQLYLLQSVFFFLNKKMFWGYFHRVNIMLDDKTE